MVPALCLLDLNGSKVAGLGERDQYNFGSTLSQQTMVIAQILRVFRALIANSKDA